MDQLSTKITWGAIVTILTLAFSSGTGWISIFNNKDANDRQWTRINDLEAKTDTHDAQLKSYTNMLASYDKSNRDLSTAITGLTVATQVASNQAKLDASQRERDARFISKLSDDMSNIRVKVERIEEKLLK